jgi:Zn-dependent protease with chaperone function
MIEGRYFEVFRSGSRPARLWKADGELRLQLEGEAKARQPKLISVSEKLGTVPRKFVFEDGGVFEAPGDADVDGLMASHRSFFSRLSRIEANRRFAAVAVIVTVALLFGIYRYGLPLVASAAAYATPAGLLDLMDSGTLQTVDATLLGPSRLADGRKADVSELFGELAKVSGHQYPGLELQFRDGGSVGANAFALPGGTIIVTDQLVEMAKNNDEIAGVLAHEIGHVEHRHSLQQIYRLLGIGFMIGLVGGDSSQIVDDVVTQAAALQSLAYSREFEADADDRSVEIMIGAGRNPVAFVDLLERITQSDPGQEETGYLSSHPGTVDRRKAVSEKAKALGW